VNRNDGGPAFPVDFEHLPDSHVAKRADGMSLRDYFAAQALALGGEYFHRNAAEGPATVATVAYEIADAMLLERAK
jgi:hypothetical protein